MRLSTCRIFVKVGFNTNYPVGELGGAGGGGGGYSRPKVVIKSFYLYNKQLF